ncbi:MAG: VCBS repeat-containing protein [Krumholzibacteria bacterium]|nr:VCBS repeat-containing protein [Candidatus Krumholzibacteria bacterium]
MDIYGADKVVPLTFYLTAPYRIPVVDQRWGMYGFSGTPSVMFDGQLQSVGGAASGSMLATYQPLYLNRAAVASPVLVAASYTIIGEQATVTTTVTVDGSLPAGTNQVHTFVALAQEHGNTNMVMAALPVRNLGVGGLGEQEVIESTFTVAPAWEQENLRIVILVQNLQSEEVLQAAVAVPDYKAAIVVDCEPDGVGAGWTITGPYGLLAAGTGDDSMDTFYAGEFTLVWQEVPYWTRPAPGSFTQTVGEGGQIVFAGVYTDGPFAAPAALPGAPAAAGRGVSLIDFDGDRDLDLHVVNQGAADLLLRNDGGGWTAVGSGGVLDAGAGTSAAWADFNGDGHLDVYVGKSGEANLLLAGDGDGGFAPVNNFGAGDLGQARTVSWVDYDNDGRLDLYVVNNGGANVLLKNLGDVGGGLYIFSAQSNGANDPGNGRGAAWADIDFDGRLDVYVTNYSGANVLLQNTPIGFSNLAQTSGLDDLGNGTGAAWGDYDNDGDWDLYLANDGGADRLWLADAFNAYNLVLGGNLGDRGRGRGVVFADLDNDTHLDLYVARNGEPDLVLMGDGAGGFTRAPVGWPEADLGSTGVACGDVDGDGRLDVFVSRDGAAGALFLNTMQHGNHWFAVRLHGTAGNPGAIGALVQVTSGGVTQMRQVTGGGGYLGMDGGPAHFGLGTEAYVSELRITWPDGTVQTTGPLQGDRVLEVTYGQQVAGVGDPVPAAVNRLAAARPNPFNPSTTIDYALATGGRVRLEVFSVDGRRVATLVDAEQAAGPHSATWQGRDAAGRAVASGTYVYRLTAPDGGTLTGRMALVK